MVATSVRIADVWRIHERMVGLGEGIGGRGSSQDQDRESAGGGCGMHRISNVNGVLRVRGMLERSDLGFDTLLMNGRQV